ncbi:hypothetical protein C2E23DRAFT_733594 [Lenzites betulinus]|nr:hypothetical protein C2E23DRAFT_733594 [Lenzites betulinus]
MCVPDPRTDFIEQIFQKVEEETERRAREQTALPAHGDASLTPPPPPQTVPPAAPAAVTVVRDATRDRRRGSISVSRFGQATESVAPTTETISALPSRTNSIIINAGKTGAFYQAQKYAGSADSFASSQEEPGETDPRDEEQVTQMEKIAGRVSIGKAMGGIIARRLSKSRTRSRDILATPSGLLIGVSVEEATTEAEHAEEAAAAEADAPRTPHGTTFVYAQVEAPRSRRSTISMPSSAGESLGAATGTGAATTTQERRLSAAGWVTKAKDLTKIFRRKSLAVLSPNSSP